MVSRIILGAWCLATASVALGQNVRPTSDEAAEPHPIGRTEGRRILATIPALDVEAESETDCSHLVHDVYEQAGFSYDYVSSNDLYVGGSTNFVRVHLPQAGDLVVWRGHVGIVIDPKEHSFFSFVRSGPDTQFYDSAYWHSRGAARFFRYLTDKPLQADRPLEAAGHSADESQPGGIHNWEDRPASKLDKPALAHASNALPIVDRMRPPAAEAPREIVLRAAGKTPSPEEVVAAFVEMNQDFGESLRGRSLSSLGKSVIVYGQVRVSAVQINGRRGAALVAIESLGSPWAAQGGPQFRWREQSLELERTKKGWVMSRIEDVAYVRREIALQALSARLADLAKNTSATPEQQREQKQIIRLLNSLVTDDSGTASAQTSSDTINPSR